MSSVTEGDALEARAPQTLDAACGAPAGEQRAASTPLLRRIYRDVGLAAVASELQISERALTFDLRSAIDRGMALIKARDAELAA